MKRFFLNLLMLVCLMSVFVACSSDDDVKYPVDEELAGSYVGSMDIYYEGMTDPIAEDLIQKVYISKASNNAIKLELKDFRVTVANVEIPIGTITIDKCTLKQNGDIYEFAGSQTLDIVVGKCNVQVTGTVGAGSVKMDISVDAVDAGLKVNVDYNGKKITNESSEAKIVSFTFDPKIAGNGSFVTEQPIINEENGTIIFRIIDTTADNKIKAMVPTITISDKAVISPATDVPQDFSAGKIVVYTVTAEDGTIKKYAVSTPRFSLVNDFETWMQGVGGSDPKKIFFDPAGWNSSNPGAHMLMNLGELADRYVVTKTEEAHSGKYAVRIETIDTQGKNMGIALVPKVTTGSLFLGKFTITDLKNTLKSTKFGIEYDKKPLSLKGYYKYTPGTLFYTCVSPETCNVATVDETKSDEFAIKAVLYETNAYTGDLDDYLTGVAGEGNIYTSSRVVAIASLEGGRQDSWKEFNLTFDYKKTFDPTKKYRFSIICSASKDGDKFWGAPGSVLTVDDFELTVDK